jgi:hypothetical protein
MCSSLGSITFRQSPLELHKSRAGKAEDRLHLDHIRVLLTLNTCNCFHVVWQGLRITTLKPLSISATFVRHTFCELSSVYLLCFLVPPLNDFLLAAPGLDYHLVLIKTRQPTLENLGNKLMETASMALISASINNRC